LNLKTKDEVGNLIVVIHWTSFLRRKHQSVGFSYFNDQFMFMAYALFHEEIPFRFYPDFKALLHFSSDTKVGDWFLFQDYTQITIYGAKVKPFKLPKFIIMRIFSLEYIRQRFTSHQVKFVSKKRKVAFKLKKEVGPFAVNNRVAL